MFASRKLKRYKDGQLTGMKRVDTLNISYGKYNYTKQDDLHSDLAKEVIETNLELNRAEGKLAFKLQFLGVSDSKEPTEYYMSNEKKSLGASDGCTRDGINSIVRRLSHILNIEYIEAEASSPVFFALFASFYNNRKDNPFFVDNIIIKSENVTAYNPVGVVFNIYSNYGISVYESEFLFRFSVVANYDPERVFNVSPLFLWTNRGSCPFFLIEVSAFDGEFKNRKIGLSQAYYLNKIISSQGPMPNIVCRVQMISRALRFIREESDYEKLIQKFIRNEEDDYTPFFFISIINVEGRSSSEESNSIPKQRESSTAERGPIPKRGETGKKKFIPKRGKPIPKQGELKMKRESLKVSDFHTFRSPTMNQIYELAHNLEAVHANVYKKTININVDKLRSDAEKIIKSNKLKSIKR